MNTDNDKRNLEDFPELHQAALDDPDCRPLSDEESGRMRPLREADSKFYAALQRENAGKERITIRLDRDVLNWFRDCVDAAGGGSYQRAINDALRAHIDHETAGPIEERLRRIVREELDRKAG